MGRKVNKKKIPKTDSIQELAHFSKKLGRCVDV